MFAIEELRLKQQRVRSLMEELRLGGVLFRTQAGFSWLTGGHLNLVGIATEMGAASLLITPDRQYVICNNIEAPRIEREEALPDQGYEMCSYPWHMNSEQELVNQLVDGKIGCDSHFPGTVNISTRLNPLRYSLTRWEVDRYKQLGALVSSAVEDTISTVKPGEKECAVIGRLAKRLWEERVDFIATFCAADGRISLYRHPIATENRIEKRAMLGINARKWGLIVCLTRFVQFGAMPADLAKQYAANVYVDCVLMAHTVPGRAAVEVFRKGLDAYAEVGYPEEWKLHHQGGAIGYAGRDYRVNFETPDIVQENQGFCWNPSITGTKSEDTILATPDGPQPVTRPISFPVMDVAAGGHSFKRAAVLQK